EEFAAGKFDILIGTQMIAKGLDFANVTLVGVVSADQMFMMPDYDSIERAFSTLTQVVGRGGRGEVPGEAVIQTYDPINPVIRLAASQDYPAFYESEIEHRRANLYPPFCRMCIIGLSSEKEEKARNSAQRMIEIMKEEASLGGGKLPIRILGPVPMRIARISSRYRFKITVKGPYGEAFRDILKRTLARYYQEPGNSGVRVYCDFNSRES
ncbi:MAG: helicase-related protein, partial [Oscillospiraceae bacterium]